MSEYTVMAYVNVGPDNFFGYKATDPIAQVDEFTIKAETHQHAAEGMWVVGNKMGCDIHGKEYPHDVRSLSVGDLVRVTDHLRVQHFFAVASMGWEPVPEPINPIVELAGTTATSRVKGA